MSVFFLEVENWLSSMDVRFCVNIWSEKSLNPACKSLTMEEEILLQSDIFSIQEKY